jgi:hypothetical protein
VVDIQVGPSSDALEPGMVGDEVQIALDVEMVRP